MVSRGRHCVPPMVAKSLGGYSSLGARRDFPLDSGEQVFRKGDFGEGRVGRGGRWGGGYTDSLQDESPDFS